jgi:hypothetical protein
MCKDKQDLESQNPDCSENIQKSERPAADYMEDRRLCRKCHAVLDEEGKCTKGCS